MSLKRTAIASTLRIALSLGLVSAVLLVARGGLSGVSPVDQMGAALQRLAMIAASDTALLRLLVVVCVACGLLVIVDRRRRSKVRQASC